MASLLTIRLNNTQLLVLLTHMTGSKLLWCQKSGRFPGCEGSPGGSSVVTVFFFLLLVNRYIIYIKPLKELTISTTHLDICVTRACCETCINNINVKWLDSAFSALSLAADYEVTNAVQEFLPANLIFKKHWARLQRLEQIQWNIANLSK